MGDFPPERIGEDSERIIREWRYCGFSNQAILEGTVYFPGGQIESCLSKATRDQIRYHYRGVFKRQLYQSLLAGELSMDFSEFCQVLGLTPEAAQEYLQIAKDFPLEPETFYPIFAHICETRLDLYQDLRWMEELEDGYEKHFDGFEDSEPVFKKVYAWPPIFEAQGENQWKEIKDGGANFRQCYDFLHPEAPVGYRFHFTRGKRHKGGWRDNYEWEIFKFMVQRPYQEGIKEFAILKTPVTSEILILSLINRYPGDQFYLVEPTIQRIDDLVQDPEVSDQEVSAEMKKWEGYFDIKTASQILRGEECSGRISKRVQSLDCSNRERVSKYFEFIKRFTQWSRKDEAELREKGFAITTIEEITAEIESYT